MTTPFQELLVKEGDKSPTIGGILTALCNIEEPEDIRKFVKEYEQDMLLHGDPEIKGREIEIARQNIGYILGYLGEKDRNRIYAALPNVSHPVFGAGFGRGHDPTPKEAIEKGEEMGRKNG